MGSDDGIPSSAPDPMRPPRRERGGGGGGGGLRWLIYLPKKTGKHGSISGHL